MGVKTKKKVLMPTFASFRGTVLAWGAGARLYPGMARRNLMNLMVRISVLATNSGVTTRKKFSALNLRLRFGVHQRVLSWNETLLTEYLGSTVPEMYTSGTGPVTLFWGTILAWIGRFLTILAG